MMSDRGYTREVMKIFREHAKRYDAWFDENREYFEEELETIRRLRRGGLSLEVGVGSGRFSKELRVEIGIDIAEELLSLAKERGVEVVLADAHRMPFRGEVFDEVLVLFTICFIEQPETVMREIRRVLRPHGSLIIGFIARNSPLGRRYQALGRRGHVFYKIARFYEPHEVEYMCRTAGFTLDETYSSLGDGEIVRGIRKGYSFCCMRFSRCR
ncbi:MAG: SAM-dependent methyltransferase [Thermoprotei archaeon]|nr:MAG: SAM-dependent methyltransferase [Thermoprotei archaeon]RLF21938.1 MAG: SAM-dependent methyltransferase [Thermoprotei archaeon]